MCSSPCPPHLLLERPVPLNLGRRCRFAEPVDLGSEFALRRTLRVLVHLLDVNPINPLRQSPNPGPGVGQDALDLVFILHSKPVGRGGVGLVLRVEEDNDLLGHVVDKVGWRWRKKVYAVKHNKKKFESAVCYMHVLPLVVRDMGMWVPLAASPCS